MKTLGRHELLAGVLLIAGAASLVAFGQDQTQAPGMPTKARVWIQNHGATEAVPVVLQPIPEDAPPLRVQMEASGGVFHTRPVRQSWEYRGITVTSTQDVAVLLSEAGADGWETSGAVLPAQNGTVVVMKRPR